MNETTLAFGAPDDPGGEKHVLTCRCEEVRAEEIIAAVVSGARSADDVKRRTRAGMGVCQGIFCSPTIAAMVSAATGVPISQVAPMTARPPTRMIALEALAAMKHIDAFPGDSSERDESG